MLAMMPARLSQECQLRLLLRDYQQRSVSCSLKQEALPSMPPSYWHQHAWHSLYFPSVRVESTEERVAGLISEEMGLGSQWTNTPMRCLLRINATIAHILASVSVSLFRNHRDSCPDPRAHPPPSVRPGSSPSDSSTLRRFVRCCSCVVFGLLETSQQTYSAIDHPFDSTSSLLRSNDLAIESRADLERSPGQQKFHKF